MASLQPSYRSDAAPASRGRRPRSQAPARALALLVALLAVGGVTATWHLLVLDPRGQRLEAAAVDGAAYGRGTLWQLAEPVLDVVSVGFVVLALGAVVTVAAVRRRWALAAQVAVLVGGANVTTQLLKHVLLDRPDYGITTYAANSLPSGHTTVAASVAMAVLLVVSRRSRPAVALLGAAYTGATGVATLIGQWHRPSDVIAAVLVVLAWTTLVCAFTRRSEVDTGSSSTRTTTTLAAGLLGAVAVVGAASGFAVLTGSDPPVIGAATAASSDVRAYVGTAALVVAATAGSFLAALLVRQTTARS